MGITCCKQACATVKAYNPDEAYPDVAIPWRNTGGNIVSLLIGLDYTYYTKQDPLTASNDVRAVYRILERAEQADCTVVLDYCFQRPDFPTKQRFMEYLRASTARCRPGDWFVFFYGGHGENMSGPSHQEEHGMDQAFVTPRPDGNIADERTYLVDDEFALAIDQMVPPGVRILCIIDCCHSGSICDIDTFRYNHDIYQMSACQDAQEAEDTGSGGTFTRSIEQALKVLSTKYGDEDYSMQEFFDAANHFACANITSDQDINFHFSGPDPCDIAMPLASHWSKYMGINKVTHSRLNTEKVEYHGVPDHWLE